MKKAEKSITQVGSQTEVVRSTVKETTEARNIAARELIIAKEGVRVSRWAGDDANKVMEEEDSLWYKRGPSLSKASK
jgi:hypothetical protein